MIWQDAVALTAFAVYVALIGFKAWDWYHERRERRRDPKDFEE